MLGGIKIRKFESKDLEQMLKIFNYYAVNSYAVYCDFELNISMFNHIIDEAKVILVLEKENQIIGYGYISKFLHFPNFSKTGLLTYFLDNKFTEKGLGTMLFNELLKEGLKIGITNYLANISNNNVQSIKFHQKKGFKIAGTFENIGNKFNSPVDMVWMQKQFNENEVISE